MEILPLITLFAFVFGAIIGSFANVFVMRYGTGKQLGGRSACASCSAMLSWKELIPVVSYVMLWGRCRKCESKISPQYPIVEAVFGAVFAGLTWQMLSGASVVGMFVYAELAYLFVASFLLLSIAIYDIRHMIIPDGMVVMLSALALAWHISAYGIFGIFDFLIAGPLVALPFFVVWLVSKGRWMGLGDAKLALPMGWMLGVLGGFSAVIFGVWMGALVGLAGMFISSLKAGKGGLDSTSGRLTMKSAIPFGPFLVAGTLFVLLSGITLETLVLAF